MYSQQYSATPNLHAKQDLGCIPHIYQVPLGSDSQAALHTLKHVRADPRFWDHE